MNLWERIRTEGGSKEVRVWWYLATLSTLPHTVKPAFLWEFYDASHSGKVQI